MGHARQDSPGWTCSFSPLPHGALGKEPLCAAHACPHVRSGSYNPLLVDKASAHVIWNSCVGDLAFSPFICLLNIYVDSCGLTALAIIL